MESLQNLTNYVLTFQSPCFDMLKKTDRACEGFLIRCSSFQCSFVVYNVRKPATSQLATVEHNKYPEINLDPEQRMNGSGSSFQVNN